MDHVDNKYALQLSPKFRLWVEHPSDPQNPDGRLLGGKHFGTPVPGAEQYLTQREEYPNTHGTLMKILSTTRWWLFEQKGLTPPA